MFAARPCSWACIAVRFLESAIGGLRNSSGSLAMFAVMRRAPEDDDLIFGHRCSHKRAGSQPNSAEFIPMPVPNGRAIQALMLNG
jgi:hypothetical protein